MIIGKRHLVLAGLLIALGAAVYLNWQFAPSETVIGTSGSGQSVYTQEGYITVSTNTVSDSSASAELNGGDAVETAVTKNLFDQTREDREKTRQEALDTLEDILEDASLDDSRKQQAVDTAAKIAENMDREAAIELLIRAKGYEDCVVVISDAQVNVVLPVGEEGLKSSDTAIIRDIVVGQVEISPAGIKIIEAK
ncbi:MAG: SpoIIIAH-like family protein [Ruminococcaceae bacterium]|nr:SpoIIIAH-like family protein [Oscillospiraceae bacterium]